MKHLTTGTFELRATAWATLALAAALASPLDARSAPFQSGNFVAYRVGSESGAKSVTLDEFRADGTVAQSLPLSSRTAKLLAASGTGSEGLLNRSSDGKCLAVPGYAVSAASADPKKLTSDLAPRAVVLVDANAGASAPISLGTSAFSTDAIRGAVSDDCQRVWISGAGNKNAAYQGVWFTNRSGSPAIQLNTTNSQGIAIDGQHLFVSFAGGETLNQLGTDLPTSGTPAATAQANIKKLNFRGIAFARLNPQSTTADTLYLAANDADEIQKYVRNGSQWVAQGSAPLKGAHGLVVLPTGEGHALLFATDSSKLYRLFDTSGATGSLTGTPTEVATAAAGEAFYGLALTPEAAPPQSAPAVPAQVKLAISGNSGTVSWTAPASGAAAAFYVVEVSHDDFASIDQSAVAASGSVQLSGLQSGNLKARVRAVNSVGASASAVSGGADATLPPQTTLPDNSAYSGVVGDLQDEVATRGITFEVTDPGNRPISVAATSDNQAVVKSSSIGIQSISGKLTLKIVPTGVGYANITVLIQSGGGASTTHTIRYAASANATANTSTRWFAGRSDASSALTVPGTDNLLVADDEAPAKDAAGNALPGGNSLFAFHPDTGGMPVSTLVPDASLNLSNAASCSNSGFTGLAKCDADGEVDLESSFLVGERMYFAGSHSNNKNGRSRPDRWRFFAVDGKSGNVTGYYQWLREDLRAWDAGNAHGLGANYLGLVSSSDGGDKNPLKAPETDTLSGFSIEGSTTSPDDTQMWLGFRAPLVTAPGQPAVTSDVADGRTHALLIPVTNYSGVLSASGGVKGATKIGAPIRLDLGGRGIREIRKNASGEYLIIAGPPNGANGTAPRDFRLFSWDGRVNAAGLALNVRALASGLAPFQPAPACSAEGIANLPNALAQGGSAKIISDCGDADFYGDGTAAKDLPYATWKKFRSDDIDIAALPAVQVVRTASTTSGASLTAQTPQAGALHIVVLAGDAPPPAWEQVKAGLDAADKPALWTNPAITLVAQQPAPMKVSGLAPNADFVAYSVLVAGNGSASLVTATPFRTEGATPPSIQFPELSDRMLGSAPFVVTATGNASAEAVRFASVTEGVCSASGDQGATIRLLALGICTVRASQTGATPVERSFQIRMPTTSGTTLEGGNGSSATVSGNGWQFGTNSAGSAATTGLPALPPGYRFVLPSGFSFVLAGGSANNPASVAWQWTQTAPEGAMLWKFGPTQADATPHWYDVKAQFHAARTGASFSIIDGGDGDEDRLANGVIVDPVFLVAPAAVVTPGQTTSVPTLSDAGRVLLALVLSGAAALGLRRRKF